MATGGIAAGGLAGTRIDMARRIWGIGIEILAMQTNLVPSSYSERSAPFIPLNGTR
jgi:hypothetical protein